MENESVTIKFNGKIVMCFNTRYSDNFHSKKNVSVQWKPVYISNKQ